MLRVIKLVAASWAFTVYAFSVHAAGIPLSSLVSGLALVEADMVFDGFQIDGNAVGNFAVSTSHSSDTVTLDFVGSVDTEVAGGDFEFEGYFEAQFIAPSDRYLKSITLNLLDFTASLDTDVLFQVAGGPVDWISYMDIGHSEIFDGGADWFDIRGDLVPENAFSRLYADISPSINASKTTNTISANQETHFGLQWGGFAFAEPGTRLAARHVQFVFELGGTPISTVPLPAGFPLLIVGMAILGLSSRTRRSASAKLSRRQEKSAA